MGIYKNLLEEGEKYEQDNRFDQAFNIYLTAEKIVKKYGSKNEIGNLCYRKGRVLAKKTDLKNALNSFNECLKLLKKGGAIALQIANVKEAMGDAYKINGNMEESLNAYQESLKILQDEKERVIYTHSHLINQILEAIAKQYHNIGKIYVLLKNWDQALENCREGLKVASDTKSISVIFNSRLTIARIYLEKKDHNTALEYLMKSIEMAKKENDVNSLLIIYLEIGHIYKIGKNSQLALDFYKKGLKLAEKLENKISLTRILDDIGSLFLKSNRKKALEFFQQSYDIGNSINQYHFEYILYHLGILHYLDADYENAYKNLVESSKYAEKSGNRQLLYKIFKKIGDVWKYKQNFDDSIYYYKKALEFTQDIEKETKILNEIGLIYLLSGNYSMANEYIQRSFDEFRMLIFIESDINKKQQLIEYFTDIPQNMCALKCRLYEKTKDIQLLKEALGFSEFLSIENMPYNLKLCFNTVECPERKKNQSKITENSLILKKLINQYKMEPNHKMQDNLLNQIREIRENLLQLVYNIWESCNEPAESFPQSGERIIDRFFQGLTGNNDSWAILKFIHINSIDTLYIFVIDILKKEIHLFSKELSETLINSILNKINQLETLKNEGSQIKIEKIYSSFINLWDKFVPKPLSNYLIKQKFKHLTLIPHSFLWDLPWEIMQIGKQYLNNLFKISRNYSLDHLRADMGRKTGDQTYILMKSVDNKECKLLFMKDLAVISSNGENDEKEFLNYISNEIKRNNNIAISVQNFRAYFLPKETSESLENSKLSYVNSFFLIGNPFSNK